MSPTLENVLKCLMSNIRASPTPYGFKGNYPRLGISDRKIKTDLRGPKILISLSFCSRNQKELKLEWMIWFYRQILTFTI